MSNFYLCSFFGILLENDPAPMQGTAKAILLRPRPPPEPTATIGTGRGQDPKAPTSTAGRSDLAGTPKKGQGERADPPRGEKLHWPKEWEGKEGGGWKRAGQIGRKREGGSPRERLGGGGSAQEKRLSRDVEVWRWGQIMGRGGGRRGEERRERRENFRG